MGLDEKWPVISIHPGVHVCLSSGGLGMKKKGNSCMSWDTSAVLIILMLIFISSRCSLLPVFQLEETKQFIQRQWLLTTLRGSRIVRSRDHVGMEPISVLWGDDGG